MKQSQNKKTKKQDNTDLDELIQEAKQKSEAKEKHEENNFNRDEELEKAQNQALRAMADLQNVKKRMEEDRSSFIKYASSSLLKKLLPIIDDIERAFTNIPTDIEKNTWVEGTCQIKNTFLILLKKEGLEEISPQKGDNFDTQFHEAVMQDPEVKEGQISQCLVKGYMFKNKVLRVATVSVGSK